MIRFAAMTIRPALHRLMLAALMLVLPLQAQAGSRIKDIADFEGIRDNMLVGYGLVVGLDGTGDSLTNAPFTKQSLAAMLERFGVQTGSAQRVLALRKRCL